MAKDKVATTTTGGTNEGLTVEVQDETPQEEIYTGNVYEFNGGLTISNNTGPVTVNIYMQGIPNNFPPK
jgi:hypothetical protein